MKKTSSSHTTRAHFTNQPDPLLQRVAEILKAAEAGKLSLATAEKRPTTPKKPPPGSAKSAMPLRAAASPKSSSKSISSEPLSRSKVSAAKPTKPGKAATQPDDKVQSSHPRGKGAPGAPRRSRVPADLATQYGERVNGKAALRAPLTDEPKVRRPRRSAAEKEKLQQLLEPDEDILARLARASAIGSTTKRAPVRRSKSWKARCGRCGTAADCAIPAALCSKCGAILMRGEE